MENLPVKSIYKQLPYSIKLCFQLLLVVLVLFIAIKGQAVFIPLYFSVLISILLLPVANFLEKLHLPRALAALIAILLAFFFIGTIIYLLSAQIITFLNDLPSIKRNLNEHYHTLQLWLQYRFGISISEQDILLNNNSNAVQTTGMVYIKNTFFTVTQTIAFTLFILIYSFLILFYRFTIKHFFLVLFNKEDKQSIEAVIGNTKTVIKRYMSGLLIEMVIISISNTIVLMALGVKYPIFLGVLTGILNIMPFIGIYSGIVFTALISLTTNASLSQITWMTISLLLVHFVDANFLMPKIVGTRVKINALITMLGAIIGGVLFGIAGVFLALPTIAILKILFDRIKGMEAWGILLGDESSFPAKKVIDRINKRLAFSAKKQTKQE